MPSPAYRVFVSAVGNVYMAEIAAALAESVGATGREVELCPSGLPRAEAGVVNLVVAPHEFFTRYEGASEADIVRAASHSICVGVEQPGTQWFEDGARYTSYGPMAADINDRGVRELQRRGVDAHRLRLGYHPGWDAWGGDDRAPRGCDLLFLGALTPRRDEFLARSAPVLAGWECDLRLFEIDRPITAGSDHFVSGRRKYEVLAASRVLLNVHQGERDYFEWVRVLEAISNGCLVVTETSGGFAPLVPAVHFLQDGLDALALRADAVLHDEALRAELARRAYDFVRKDLALVDIVDRFLDTVEHTLQARGPVAAPRPADRAIPEALQRPATRRPLVAADTGSGAPSAGAVSGPTGRVAVTGPPPPVRDGGRSPMPGLDAPTAETPEWPGADPEVTVVIPLTGDAPSVRRAVASVKAGHGVRADVVVVDDHASERALGEVRTLMEDAPGFPVRLVALSTAAGRAAALDLGIEAARAPVVLLLDPDSTLFPRGLLRLLLALEGTDAAFAYGVTATLGDHPGLHGFLPWDVSRLVVDDCVGAMALVRKDAWRRAGGFDPGADQPGSSVEYDLWLHLAALGLRGQLSSTLVGQTRAVDPCVTELPGPDLAARREYFRSKYPGLPWASLR